MNTENRNHDLRELRSEDLCDVSGCAGRPTPPGNIPQGMAPPKYSAGWWDAARASGNLSPPTPFKPPVGMAPPKYSAGWWDIVRSRGLAK